MVDNRNLNLKRVTIESILENKTLLGRLEIPILVSLSLMILSGVVYTYDYYYDHHQYLKRIFIYLRDCVISFISFTQGTFPITLPFSKFHSSTFTPFSFTCILLLLSLISTPHLLSASFVACEVV